MTSQKSAIPTAPRGILCLRVFLAVLLSVLGSGAFADEGFPEPITYSEHIRPILEASCVQCHMPGQIGPMSLQSFDEVRPWAKSIKVAVASREMPPFHAAGPLGRYVDDPRLTEEQIQLVSRWADTGARPGPPVAEDQATPRPAGATGWLGGTPDLILETEPYTVRDGNDDYVTHLIDYTFPEETWIARIELLQTDYSIVHHSLLHLLTESKAIYHQYIRRQVERGKPYVHGAAASLKLLGLHLGGWLPGRTSELNIPFGHVTVPAGSQLVLNNHYYTREDRPAEAGRPTVQTRIGIYYLDGEITRVRKAMGPATIDDLVLQPGQANYTRTVESEFTADSYIDNYDVHMHLRGKSSRATLVYPDGRRELIFEVPRYDFGWQRYYRLKEPIFAPRGSRVIHEGVWDNSADNPNNPDPTQTVVSGLLSGDEMWVSAVGYFEAEPMPEPVRIVKGKRVE